MISKKQKIGILHYSYPPIIGGVESVMEDHARLFTKYGFKVTILVGRGEEKNKRISFKCIPEIDSNYRTNKQLQSQLSHGIVPKKF